MSRPLTLEQSLLNEADRLLTDFSLLYERRLQVLEACASRTGGFDIDEYWKEFKIDVTDGEAVKSAAETLSTVLAETDIPASLAIRCSTTVSQRDDIVMFAAQPFVAGYSAQHDNT